MYLGSESIDAQHVPVYGTREDECISSRERAVEPAGLGAATSPRRSSSPTSRSRSTRGFASRPFTVPHRDEFTDTVGYLIEGPHKKVLFIPDIDQWQKWSRDIREVADKADVAFLDGTFASASEVPGRSIADIPHPLIPATRELLKGLPTQLWFIHLNHTNTESTRRTSPGTARRS